jgi:MFS family permease
MFAMFGNGLTYITLSWCLAKGEHNVAAISGLMFCFWLPNILLSPFLGVVADRFDKKQILFSCSFSRMCLFLVFYGLFTFYNSNAFIYLLALIIGCIISLYIPAAMAYVREIVDESDLLNANATADMAYELGAVLGMGSSGVIIAVFGESSALLINAFCYFIAMVFIQKIPNDLKRKNKETSKSTYFEDLKEGFDYLLQNPYLLGLYCIQMLTFASYMTAPVLLVPFAKSVLHASVSEFGLIEGAMSLGMVFGGLLSPYLASQYGSLRVICLQVTIGAICFVCFSHSHLMMSALTAYLVIGFSFSAWALITTLAQEKTEMAFQGRVQSLFNSVSGLFILAFYLVLGSLGETFPVANLYWVEVMLLTVCASLILTLSRRALPRITGIILKN